MVEITLHVALVALKMGLAVKGIIAQRLVAVAHAVRFDIGLGYDINAVAVTKIVPQGIIGIVAGADGIDIELFHQTNILKHALG